ncbi:hypothetical protein PV341_23700, partial [Streptomyces sp. PA03-1a]|nr:hypothetical protein [Streptomyces sp. PA03-1a]
MAITEDIVKTLKDPTPLYALAGTADLAAEKLKEVPPLIEKIRAEAPERIEKIRGTDPKAVQEKVTAQAKDAQTKAQAKVNELLGTIDGDLRKLRDSAQDFALQQVGRAAEYAVRAKEAYDGLAERGKDAVATWRGEAADQVEDIAVAIEPEPVPAARQGRGRDLAGRGRRPGRGHRGR